MEDIYVLRNERRIIVLRGKRSGRDRRISGSIPQMVKLGSYVADKRKKLADRRQKRSLSVKEKFFERMSCLINGVVLLGVGLFFFLTGLTFLPIIGLFVGLYIIFQSVGIFWEVFSKLE
ncbi:MAG: hypothetical protein MI742_13655 [Desulfobacterales bacterium]|nr:hypothetical protein [Desulfobacterales bacterium]